MRRDAADGNPENKHSPNKTKRLSVAASGKCTDSGMAEMTLFPAQCKIDELF